MKTCLPKNETIAARCWCTSVATTNFACRTARDRMWLYILRKNYIRAACVLSFWDNATDLQSGWVCVVRVLQRIIDQAEVSCGMMEEIERRKFWQAVLSCLKHSQPIMFYWSLATVCLAQESPNVIMDIADDGGSFGGCSLVGVRGVRCGSVMTSLSLSFSLLPSLWHLRAPTPSIA